MSPRRKALMIVYGVCAVAGAVVPWIFNIQHMMTSDVPITPVTFVEAGMVSPLARSITFDFFILVTAVLTWMMVEGRRLGMRRLWVYVVLTFGIAVAFACPLFLLMRERLLSAQEPS